MNKTNRARLHVASEADAIPLSPQEQPVTVRRLDREHDDHFIKRTASIQALGARWWQHPAYAKPARHSLNPEQFEPAREPYMASIRAAAAADRARNSLALMQQSIRDAIGGK